jgi:mRNA (guanine-N7-)-methyltransferase
MPPKRERAEDAAVDAAQRAARDVALHYSNRDQQSNAQRQLSPIYHLRCLNNWVKSSLISEYVRERDRVLDYACGKGGDLTKYRKAKVGSYVGVDIALESVRRDATERYNSGDYPFPATFIAGDGFAVDLLEEGKLEPRGFDVVSCQFAIHYSWSTEERARRSFRNVAKLLRPGGYFIGTTVDANVLVRKLREADGLRFGNDVVEVRFHEASASKLFPESRGPFGLRYSFTLRDAVTDCDEWMVPKKQFVELAEEFGLELVEWANFHEFVGRRLGVRNADAERRNRARDLWRQTAGGKTPEESQMTEDEWEAARLYAAFAFRMSGSAEAAAKAVLSRSAPEPARKIKPSDVLVLAGAA